ncbi:MAG: hypothetical protein WAM11_09185, partial [Cyanobium sp.]
SAISTVAGADPQNQRLLKGSECISIDGFNYLAAINVTPLLAFHKAYHEYALERTHGRQLLKSGENMKAVHEETQAFGESPLWIQDY